MPMICSLELVPSERAASCNKSQNVDIIGDDISMLKRESFVPKREQAAPTGEVMLVLKHC
eukprot:6174181-Pleurochrysis_carterae.AAC.6